MTHLAQNGFRWQHAIPFLWWRTSFNLTIHICIEHLCTSHIGAPLELVAVETRGECAAGMYMASTKGNLSEVFQCNQPARNLEIKTASQAKWNERGTCSKWRKKIKPQQEEVSAAETGNLLKKEFGGNNIKDCKKNSGKEWMHRVRGKKI